ALPCSWRGGVPDVVHTVARLVPGLAVLAPVVQRLALVGHLLGAVVALNQAIAVPAGCRRGGQGRPVGGTGAIADGFAAAGHVLVEDIALHALGPAEHANPGAHLRMVLGMPAGQGQRAAPGTEFGLGFLRR